MSPFGQSSSGSRSASRLPRPAPRSLAGPARCAQMPRPASQEIQVRLNRPGEPPAPARLWPAPQQALGAGAWDSRRAPGSRARVLETGPERQVVGEPQTAPLPWACAALEGGQGSRHRPGPRHQPPGQDTPHPRAGPGVSGTAPGPGPGPRPRPSRGAGPGRRPSAGRGCRRRPHSAPGAPRSLAPAPRNPGVRGTGPTGCGTPNLARRERHPAVPCRGDGGGARRGAAGCGAPAPPPQRPPAPPRTPGAAAPAHL